jgi:hypothetical protein
LKKPCYSFVVLAIICAGLLLPASGCFEKTDNRAEIEKLHALYLETESKVSDLTDFLDALSDFDLENAPFLDDARKAIEASRADTEELRGELNALRGFKYSGDLQQLGSDIADYCDRVERALTELDEMYQPLLGLLRTLEPTLREEAVITQMEAPKSDADFTDRIIRICTALDNTMSEIGQVQVPETLKNYKLLLTEMFGALERASKGLLAMATGQGGQVDLNSNPDMDRFLQVQELNAPLMLDIKESLMVYGLDDCMQKVEDDFFNLFLQLEREEENG